MLPTADVLVAVVNIALGDDVNDPADPVTAIPVGFSLIGGKGGTGI